MAVHDDLRARLASHFKTHPEITQRHVAKAIGRSDTVVSQWLNGRYAGANEDISSLIASYLDREEQKKARPRTDLGFVEIRSARRILEVASLCHQDGEIAVITGEAGLGKTTSLREYARRHRDVIMIEADPSESAHSIITQIHEALRFDGRGTLKGMFRDAVERLKDSGRLIIIDEAEHLQYRALEMVRRLHDKTGIGIVLAGMNRLYSNLRGRTAQYAQLYSRVAVYVRLEPATDADVVAVLQTVFPDINGTATQFCRLSRGSMRHLEKLVRRVIRMAEINGCAVDDDLVVAAAQSLIF